MAHASNRAGKILAAALALAVTTACDFPTGKSQSGQPSVASYSPRRFMIDVGGGAVTSEPGAAVSPAFFADAKVAPLLGRVLTDADTSQSFVVFSHGLWSQRFGSSPSIIGQEVEIDQRPMTVVGVMPEGFAFPEGARLWVKR
jgi:hypothetical protein